MDERILRRHFRKMGAELKVDVLPEDNWRNRSLQYELDVERDPKGEVFSLRRSQESLSSVVFMVVDVRPVEQHLLLLVKQLDRSRKPRKQKFLCGHDERHWFIAAVPDMHGVATVDQAMEALKPQQARDAQADGKVKNKDRNRRRNAGYLRQGEWFFIPRPKFQPQDERLILRKEPIQRLRGTPHMVEMLYRVGGETVYVSVRHPEGLTESRYHALIQRDPHARKLNWRVMRRNPRVYARGKVRHPDHKTIILTCWHQVAMSAERTGRGNANMVFLD